MWWIQIIAFQFITVAAAFSSIDGTTWQIVGKSCSSTPVNITYNERFVFSDGLFAFIYRLSENDLQYCNQARISYRTIQSWSESDGNYSEVSVVTPYLVKTVCTSKQDKKVISDVTNEVQGATETASFLMKSDNTGTADWTQTDSCQNTPMHFELLKK